MCDDGTCLSKRIQNTKFNGLTVDLAACRSYDQFYKVCNFFALQDFCCCHQIFQTSVCTGTDKYLIDGLTLKLADITDLVHL